jgi:hypothetical protein
MKPRESLYGGRRMVTKMYRDHREGEKIKHINFCSFYPFCLKWRSFPKATPKIFIGEKCPDIREIFGVVKIKILAPRYLLFPVLPVKFDGKVMFPLCRSCMEERRVDFCNHDSVDDSCFIGTYVSEEAK